MNTRRLVPLYCSATLFLTAVAGAQPSSTVDLPLPPPADRSRAEAALAPPVHHEHPLTPQEQELLQRYDKNGDGKLDAGELEAAHGAAQQAKQARDQFAAQVYNELLAKFDPEHEEKLTRDQQLQAVDYLSANRPRFYQAVLKQFDRNGDGKLDIGETTALFQYLANLPQRNELPAGAAPPTTAAQSPAPQPPDLAMSLEAVPATPPAGAKGAKRGGPMGAQFYAMLLQRFDHQNQGSLDSKEQAEAIAYLQTNTPRIYARLLTRFDRNHDGVLDANETAAFFAHLAKASEKATASQ